MDFGELKNDTQLIEKTNNITNVLNKVEESIKAAVEFKDYEFLSVQDKVKLDLYLSYSINSLYWMYIKLQGEDANSHLIKNELARIREVIIRDKKIYERNTIRPVIDKAAAGRFVRHGLHDRSNRDKDKEQQKNKDTNVKEQSTVSEDNEDDKEDSDDDEPKCKRIRFNEDEDSDE